MQMLQDVIKTKAVYSLSTKAGEPQSHPSRGNSMPDQSAFKPVYILGAGASAMVGMPLLKNFIRRAQELRYGGKLRPEIAKMLDTVFHYQAEVYKSRRVTGTDLDNLETLFSVLDLAWVTSKDPELASVREGLFAMIIMTLQESKADSKNAQLKYYNDTIRTFSLPLNSTFITFNYDLCLEEALLEEGERDGAFSTRIDYCLPDKFLSPIRYNQIKKVIKLHGSGNWVWCSGCNNVHIQTDYVGPTVLSMTHMEHTKECQSHSPKYLILPPTWNKINYTEAITQLWARCIEELSQATHIVVIGYSFPRTDVFFEQMFTVAMQKSVFLKRVYIVDPNKGMQSEILTGLFDKHFLEKSVTFIASPFEAVAQHFHRLGSRDRMKGSAGFEQLFDSCAEAMKGR